MMKRKKEILASLLIFALVLGGYLTLLSFILQAEPRSTEPTSAGIPELLDNQPRSSKFTPDQIRVAIYNEPNTTLPAYASTGWLVNDYAPLFTLLNDTGYQVTELTRANISRHELTTANYDVFVLADNLPRENITNLVKEFWLGGGGILSLDSAINYICYAGMIPPESKGDDGYLTYWTWGSMVTNHNVTRHPITKAYKENDIFTGENMDWGSFYWNVLKATSVGSEVVKVGTKVGSNNEASVVAFDPSNRGGRVVQAPCDGNPVDSSIEDLLVDAINWLCPRPKGRILFDLSHYPFYGVDPWDPNCNYGGRYEIWRDNLVNRSYTFDKLYPFNNRNLTATILAPYDLLIIVLPDINFTTSEVTAITNWVKNDGGQLLVLGDNITPTILDNSQNINYLLSNFDLWMNNLKNGQDTADSYVDHPIVEGCTEIQIAGGGLVNYTGDAYPIWRNNPMDAVVAAQENCSGRIILASDINFLEDQYIDNQDNLQFGINVVNWLTASDADVLLYGTEPNSGYTGDNYYKTPVANALNDLGINFYLTHEFAYFNLSLNIYNWYLAIMDIPWSFQFSTYNDDIVNYIDNGGRIIISTWDVDMWSDLSLWNRLGFEYAADIINEEELYIWDTNHPIFNTPFSYGAANFTSTVNYGDDGDRLTVYPYASALAGYTATKTDGEAVIVLRNDGKTLYNGYLIDEFHGDLDNSTYRDSFELWENEISFMYPGPNIPPGLPAGAGDDDDGGGGEEEFPGLLIIIIIIAVAASIVALIGISAFLRRKR